MADIFPLLQTIASRLEAIEAHLGLPSKTILFFLFFFSYFLLVIVAVLFVLQLGGS